MPIDDMFHEDLKGDIGVTDKEFYKHRLETSRRALMELIAKVEHPAGDALSEILVNAINDIEALQEDAEED